MKKGEKKGRRKASLSCIRNIMETMQTSAEDAMNMLGIPMEERAFYISKIKK
jgi:hypothetical protein